MFDKFSFLELASAFIALFAVIDIIGSIPIILALKDKGKKVNAMKATLLSFSLDVRILLCRQPDAQTFQC
jgi:multiple antibiotic resistance protein